MSDLEPEVEIVTPTRAHEKEFLQRAQESRELHGLWITAPSDSDAFARYIHRVSLSQSSGFLVREIATSRIVGVVNINDIRMGSQLSGSLGYYGFEPRSGRGHMTQGVKLVVDYGFLSLGLHRLEANIQPGNLASKALVKRLGFRMEGFSPRYLYIADDWRDHERWAILTDEWKS